MASCVIPHLYHVVPGGIYRRQAGGSYNPHAYEHIQEISDHTFHRESGWAHAGLLSLDVPHMPKRFRNSVIFGSIHGCSLKQNVLKPNGSSYTASRGDDFLTSADKNVRPINLKWGPNGDIYLIDWHDQNPCHQAAADAWDYERGRVYRIQLKGRPAKKAENLGQLSRAELVTRAITATDPWERRTALRLFAGRDDPFHVRGLPLDANLAVVMLLRHHDGHGVQEGSLSALTGFLARAAEGRPAARAFIARGLGEYVGGNPAAVLAWLVEEARRTADAAVRRELASAAVRLADKQDVSALVHGLMARKEDAADPLIPHLTWLAYEKVVAKNAEPELAWLAKNVEGNPFVADRIVPKVMRRLAADHLDACLKFAADLPAAAREPALGGLAVALGDKSVSPPVSWAALRDKFPGDPLLDPLAVAFRDPSIGQRTEALLRDSHQPTADRVEAVRRYARLRGEAARDMLGHLIANDRAEAVRVEAARQLVVVSDPDMGSAVLRIWDSYPKPLRAELVTTLAGRKEWARALLAAVKAGTVDRADLTDNHISRMQALKDQQVNDLVATAWGRSRPTPKELEATIDKMRGELATGSGSFGKGKVVFAAQCQKCHQFDGAGANVGPALDGAGRDIEYILANVIDPNRVIGAPYFQRIVTLQDGRVEQGILAEEDDQSITLKVENGVLKKFARTDLDGPVKVVEKSLMPEGLTYGMSVQDFRDLTVYLMASPYPGSVGVGEKVVPVPVGGLVPLPPGDGKPLTLTLTLKVTAGAPLTTSLAVGSGDPFTVSVDGKVVGEGKGAGQRPDAERVPLTLAAGDHTVTLTLKWSGRTAGVYVRLLDPDRKLTGTR